MMKNAILTISLTLFSIVLFAQHIVTVKVVEAKTGDPLPNVSVKIKNTSKGGSTNASGVYEIQVPSDAVLEITSIGYTTVLVPVQGQSEISVRLEAVTVDLGDVVVIGTRGAARAKIETPIPVDVIRINQAGMPTAKMELTSVLNIAATITNKVVLTAQIMLTSVPYVAWVLIKHWY